METDINTIITHQTPQNFRRNYVRDSVTMSDEQFHEVFQDIVTNVKCVMALVNAAGFSAMTNAVDAIKKTRLYKGQAKKYINKAVEAYAQFEYNLKYSAVEGVEFFAPLENIKQNHTRDEIWDWYLDIGAFSYKRNVRQVEMLRMQIYQEFTRIEAQDKEALSYVCTANLLLGYSTDAYNQLMKDFRERDHFNYSEIFKPFRMDNVVYWFNKASEKIGKMSGIPVGLDIDERAAENIKKAFECYENAIMLDLFNMQSADEAIEANKHLMSKKNYREYRAMYNEAVLKRTGKIPVYDED